MFPSSRLFLFPSLLGALLVGCAPADSDGDGLTDDEEATLGTDPAAADSDADGLDDLVERDAGSDPLNADSDGDRLEDGDEADAGTDATVADTDGDGYGDADELLEGKDPTDPASVIYTGGWPYYWDKASLDPGNWDAGGAAIDGHVPDLVGVDQFGEEVHLHDFAMHGAPVMIDTSAGWCGPCRNMAQWLANGDDGDATFGDMYTIKEMLENGELYWVTILYQDAQGNEATADQTANWDRAYTNENIAVVTDPGSAMVNHIAPYYIPNLSIVREDMTWGYVNPEGDYLAVMQMVIDGDY